MSHKFEIKGEALPTETKLLMDGKLLENVTSVELLIDWRSNCVNRIRLKFIPDVISELVSDGIDVAVNAEVWITDEIKQLVKEIEEKNG